MEIPPELNLPLNYVEALREGFAASNVEWLDRALSFWHMMTTEFTDLGFPNDVYGSEAGAHLAWSLMSIHLFTNADEGDDPDLVYWLQVFDNDSQPQVPSRSASFHSAREILNAASSLLRSQALRTSLSPDPDLQTQ